MTRPYTRAEWDRLVSKAKKHDLPLHPSELDVIEATIENGFAPDPIDKLSGTSFADVAREITENITGETQHLRRKNIRAGDTIWFRPGQWDGPEVHVAKVIERRGDAVHVRFVTSLRNDDWLALTDLRIYHVERTE